MNQHAAKAKNIFLFIIDAVYCDNTTGTVILVHYVLSWSINSVYIVSALTLCSSKLPHKSSTMK